MYNSPKNDQKEKGTHILIASIHQINICPFSNLKNIICVGPRVERSLVVQGDKSTPTRFQFNAFLRKTLLTINHTHSANNSHSFLIGGAKCLTINWVSQVNSNY